VNLDENILLRGVVFYSGLTFFGRPPLAPFSFDASDLALLSIERSSLAGLIGL